MTEVSCRPFEPEDGKQLAALHRRAILAVPDRFYTDAERQSWASGIRPEQYGPGEDGTMEVAVAPDGRVVAFGHSVADEVYGLYVDPDWQGRGLGSRLLAGAEAAIAGRGHRQARVESTVSARGFYEAHGYGAAAPSKHRTRGGLTLAAVRLVKPLG